MNAGVMLVTSTVREDYIANLLLKVQKKSMISSFDSVVAV